METRTLRPLYRKLASAIQARANCEKSGNDEWFDRHTQNIEKWVKDVMPYGAGIDTGTQIDLDQSSGQKLVFTFSFHHMDEHGGYAGWTDHKLIVTPSFDGIDLRITGSDRNQIKDYLHDAFNCALCTMIDIQTGLPVYDYST